MTSFNQDTAVPSWRMPILRCAFSVLLAAALGACNTDAQTGTASAELDAAAERDTLMAMERKWSDMYGQGDVDGIAELLAGVWALPAPGRSRAVGRDSVIEATRARLAAGAADGLAVSWEPQAAFISSSGDMAYDYGRATTTLADGTVVEGSYLVVWTKEDGEWKAVADIFN